MKPHLQLLISAALLSAVLSASAREDDDENGAGQDQKAAGHDKNGKFLFEKETFGGNGRTCSTCHGKETGKFSIEEAQHRFAKDPNDPLFRPLDSDDGVGNSFTRLLATGTVRVDVPLAANVKLVTSPAATRATFFRGTPTTRNVTTLQHFLMFDGRESSSDLPHQALSAVHQHAENLVEPTIEQLGKIAEFERTDERFFSSKALKRFAEGGPAPKLPPGKTASEKRGREFMNSNRQCGVCHSGPMLDTTSEFDTRFGAGSQINGIGAGLLLGPPGEAFDSDGNFVIHPNNPNPNQAFEITLPDGSSFVAVFPDLGRAAVTGDPDQIIDFKIQTLWGIKDTAPYFHDNSARTLEEVVDHYQRFFQFVDSPADFIQITDQDKADIVAYIKLL
jgi:cytochrome c peroxidase